MVSPVKSVTSRNNGRVLHVTLCLKAKEALAYDDSHPVVEGITAKQEGDTLFLYHDNKEIAKAKIEGASVDKEDKKEDKQSGGSVYPTETPTSIDLSGFKALAAQQPASEFSAFDLTESEVQQTGGSAPNFTSTPAADENIHHKLSKVHNMLSKGVQENNSSLVSSLGWTTEQQGGNISIPSTLETPASDLMSRFGQLQNVHQTSSVSTLSTPTTARSAAEYVSIDLN